MAALQWQGDEARLGQLCQLFGLASSPDNSIQQQVMQTLNQFAALEDFNLYLVTLFAKMATQEEVVRQRAGLLLKTNLSRSGPLNPQVADYIQGNVLLAVRDPSKVIRHTAGTIITTMVEKAGVAACGPTLDQLAQFLSDPSAEVQEGSFNAINKICEDGVKVLAQVWEAPPPETKPFVVWCSDRVLPRVFEFANPNAPVHSRQNAIECLNHFALNWMFSSHTYPELLPFAQKYVEVLGVLAQDPNLEILRHVCKGFVCVIENNWDFKNAQMCEVVLQYMLKASQHPEYVVRLEALEVWTPCTRSAVMITLLRPMLPDLVPVLLANMVYSPADYMGMEQAEVDEDNAAVPDQLEDIKPRFHKEKDEEPDEDDNDEQQRGGAWGNEWTARKAAASSLDHIAGAFGADILPLVLPQIQAKLQDQSWEVQESGVLALGAIAFGCMQSLVEFLPRVIQLLLRLCEAPKPLLRSISCWCASRFAQWICHDQNPDRDEILRSVLSAILQRVLDKNKRVQEAACSAFCELEEKARSLLVPYLDDIIGTLVRAFHYFQAKNQLILYDATGTLAYAVGPDLDQPKYVEALMTPLLAKFESIPDNDRSLVSLFECISTMVQTIGRSCIAILPKIVERCVRMIVQGARGAKLWLQNPNEHEKPDREVMAASIDMLSGIIEGLTDRSGELLSQNNFMCVVPEVLDDTAMQVKQSAFALVGDCSKHCIQFAAPFLPQIIPQCAKSLRENVSATVSNNASWAIGEITIKVGPEYMAPYLDDVLSALITLLKRIADNPHQKLLRQNVCTTLGRLGLVCGPHVAKALPEFAGCWLTTMRFARWDFEKVNAFQGLCNMIKANPEAVMNCVPELCASICSFYPAPAPLEPTFRQILSSYKQQLGANWSAVYPRMDKVTVDRLQQMYQIGPA